MISMSLCRVAVLACALSSCGGASTQMIAVADAGNPIGYLQVDCRVSSDLGFVNKSMVLRIRNPSDQVVEDVRLIFAGGYSVTLADLIVTGGFWDGTHALARSSILPRDELEFIFSHDVSNHHVVRNDLGESLPRTTVPSVFGIESTQGYGAWRFR